MGEKVIFPRFSYSNKVLLSLLHKTAVKYSYSKSAVAAVKNLDNHSGWKYLTVYVWRVNKRYKHTLLGSVHLQDSDLVNFYKDKEQIHSFKAAANNYISKQLIYQLFWHLIN